MDDVLPGSFLLLLLGLAVLFGYWLSRRSQNGESRLTSPTRLGVVRLLPNRAVAGPPALPLERWLARVKRATAAPSPDDGAAVRNALPDPSVGRLSLAYSQ